MTISSVVRAVHRVAPLGAICLVASAALAPVAVAQGQESFPDLSLDLNQYVHQSWSLEDGLPDNNVTTIAQTRDGYLWIGTQGGLARFNGVDFTTFTTANTPEFRTNWVRSLLETRDGSLWIGFWVGGLARLKDGVFTTFSVADGLPHESVNALVEGPDSVLWIGTDGGFAKYESGAVSAIEGFDVGGVLSLVEGPNGSVRIGTRSSGVLEYDGADFTTLIDPELIGSELVTKMLAGVGDTLWVGTFAGHLFIWDGDAVGEVDIRAVGPGRIGALIVDSEGVLWMGVNPGGLYRGVGAGLDRYVPTDRALDDRILTLFPDRDGSLWFGTQGAGLHRLKRGRLRTYGRRQGLAADDARALFVDTDGVLWVGSTRGVDRFEDGRFTSFRPAGRSFVRDVSAIHVQDDGVVWVGTQDDGVYRFEGGQSLRLSTADGLSTNRVRAVLQASTGDVWIATNGGLSLYRSGEVTTYPQAGSFPGQGIFTIYEDTDGVIWVGNNQALARFRDGEYEIVLADVGARAIHEDVDGIRWIGTTGNGLLRSQGGDIVRITRRDGLHDDYIRSILEDDAGRLWMCGARGIFHVDKRELNAFENGVSSGVRSTAYGRADGMKSVECTYGVSVPRAGGGGQTFWFATRSGVVRVDPNEPSRSDSALVRIEAVLHDGMPLALASRVEIPPSRRRIEFHFAALNYLEPERITYRYRLDGSDDDWIEAGSTRSAIYDNLPPGEYRFEVAARLGDEQPWSFSNPTVTLELQPFFYETTWFMLLTALLVGALALSGHHWRLAGVEARREELAQKVKERTAEVEYQRDQLREAELRARLLQKVASAANTAEVPADALRAALMSVTEYTGWPYAHALVPDRGLDGAFVSSGIWQVSDDERFQRLLEHNTDLVVRSGVGLPGRALAAREPISMAIDSESGAAPDELRPPEMALEAGIRHGIAFPVLVGDEVTAVLEFGSEDEQGPSGEDMEFLRRIGFQLGIALSRYWSEERLRESEVKHRALYESSRDPVALFSPEGLIDCNDAYLEMFAFDSRDAIKGMSWADPRISAQLQAGGIPAKEAAVEILGRAMRGETVKFEWVHLRPDGKEFPAEVLIWPISLAGEVTMQAVVRDITERKVHEEALEAAKRAADSANQAKSTFLANMSHEIRTPMNAILGFAQIMDRDPAMPPSQRERIDTILSSGEHLMALINNVLEMSKIEAGHTELNPTTFDFDGVMHNVEAIFQFRAAEEGLHLTFEREDRGPVFVRTDEGKLRQILINLLGNAVKFTRHGSVWLRTEVEEEADGYTIRIEVEDTGAGIAENESEAIFEAFEQSESGRSRQEGTGLGLPISRAFARLMGGDVTVESEVGRGSTFRFSFRAERRDPADVGGVGDHLRVVGLAAGQEPIRVLAVDDYEPGRRVLVELLSLVGIEVREAENGQEAIDSFESWHPHVILMDGRMPVMDGWDATSIIRDSPQGRETVILAVTASVFETDRERIMAGGADGFLRKPFRERELFTMLEDVAGIEFEYAPVEDAAESADGPDVSALSPELVATIPEEARGALKQAVQDLDVDRLGELIVDLSAEHEVAARAMQRLVDDFAFQDLADLL